MDESFSMGEAISFTNGKGYTLPSVVSSDPGNVDYLHTLKFPIGLSLFWGFLLNLGVTPPMADLLLEFLAAIVFFLSWFVLLENLQGWLHPFARAFVWFYLILFPASLFAGGLTGHTADSFGVALIYANIALVVLGLQQPRRLLLLSALGGLAGGVAALLKYIYWPTLAIVPITLGLLGLLHRRDFKRLLTAGVVNAVAGGFFLAIMMTDALVTTGHLAGYVLTMSGEIVARIQPLSSPQWDQALWAIPAPGFSVGVTPWTYFDVRNMKLVPLKLVGDRWAWGFSILVLLALVFVVVQAVRGARNWQGEPGGQVVKFVFLSGLVTVVWVLCWQVWLSVAYAPSKFIGGWVPLMEMRYYTPIFTFLTLGFAHSLFSMVQLQKRIWTTLAFLLLGTAALLSIASTVKSRMNVVEKQLAYGWRSRAVDLYEARTEELSSIIDLLEPGQAPVVVMLPDKDRDYFLLRESTFLLGVPGLILPDNELSTSQPVTIVLIFQKSIAREQFAYYKDIVDQYGGTCMGLDRFNYCNFLLAPNDE